MTATLNVIDLLSRLEKFGGTWFSGGGATLALLKDGFFDQINSPHYGRQTSVKTCHSEHTWMQAWKPFKDRDWKTCVADD